MTDPYLISGPSFDTVTLERLKVGTQRHTGATVAQSIELRRYEDKIVGDLVYELTAYVLAEKLPRVEESSSKSYFYEIPASWFQHLKQTIYRWRRLSWLERRWPARYETHERKATLTVNLERYRTYPKADVVLPPSQFGQPVHVAVTRKDWLWN